MLFTNCSEEEDYIFEDQVEQEMIEHFRSFAKEAELRGRIINWNDEMIATQFTSIEDDAIGKCLIYEDGRRLINIDRDNWDKSSRLKKEFLIYHELGHCLLKRSHTNAMTLRGTCLSIMNSGENICITNYHSTSRKFYLDELFL